MEYIRSDNERTTHLLINYMLLPTFEGAQEPDYDFSPLTEKVFSNYEAAAAFALTTLKYPDKIFADPEIADKLKTLECILIVEQLLVVDDDKTIDCPLDYMYDVGCVYKYYGDDEEGETIIPKLVS